MVLTINESFYIHFRMEVCCNYLLCLIKRFVAFVSMKLIDWESKYAMQFFRYDWRRLGKSSAQFFCKEISQIRMMLEQETW